MSHGLVPTVRWAVAAPFVATGIVLTMSGYLITLLAEHIAGSEL